MVVEIVKPPEIRKSDLHVIPDDGEYDNGENQVQNENVKMVKLEGNRSKVMRELRKIDTSYNPTGTPAGENIVKPEIRDGNAIVTCHTNVIPIQIEDTEMA